MWAVNMLPVWALPSIELIQKCQTRRRIVDVAKGKRNKRSQPVGSLDGWCDSLGGRRQPVYIWHPAPESAQDVTQRPVQRGQCTAPGSPETFWCENSARGWSPDLSVVGRLQFDGWDIPAVLVEAAVVEPVDPFSGGQFDVVDGLPGLTRFDQLGFVQAVDGL